MNRFLIAAVGCCMASSAVSQEVLNLYSSRHYDTDERLYSDFEEETGIKINRIEGNADELIARMLAEGANSPADILLTVDTSRLERARNEGLFQSIQSDTLEARIPENLQDENNQWFGFSQRARIFFYDSDEIQDPPQSYADLADPRFEGRVCSRSGTNVYSQTLLASLVANLGEEAAREWAAGVVNNFARDPQGGDTDQLRAIVSGECDIAISNTYYFARAIRTDVSGLSDEDLASIGWVFPDQGSFGAHMNISGGGVATHAPNRDNAVRFLEYLTSRQAQEYFSAGNDEYPAVAGVALSPSVEALGEFQPDAIDLSDVAEQVGTATRIFNEVGWE